jgi:PAS domain-containing protein
MDSLSLTVLSVVGLCFTVFAFVALMLQRRASRRVALMAATFDTLTQARLVTDAEGRSVVANSAWGRQFGIDRDKPFAHLERRLQGDREALDQLARLKSSYAKAPSNGTMPSFRPSGECPAMRYGVWRTSPRARRWSKSSARSRRS